MSSEENEPELEPKSREYNFKPGVVNNPHGRPRGSLTSDKILEDDREYYGVDSRKFLERALLKARTWEEGLKFAKELRMLQHPSLQSIQTRTEAAHTLTLRWSRPDEIPSNDKITTTIEVIQHDSGVSNKGEEEA